MKRWYVIQVFAGYEEAVKKDLEKRIKEEDMGELIGEVLIPSAKIKKLFGEEGEGDQQLFPGYMLVEMEMLPNTKKLIISSPRVVKFLGGLEPSFLSKKEVEHIKAQVKGDVAIAPQESPFHIGSEIDIKEGPFAGFVGIIEKIDEENERLTVMVSIFGRLTPVELRFEQVKR